MRVRRLDELPLELRQRFAAGRVWAAHQAPYLASGLLALDPVVIELELGERADLSAFPTDRRWHVYVDPEALAATEVPELGFWLLHQVSHLLRDHAKRFPDRGRHVDVQPTGGRTPAQRRWNIVTDAELDDDLSTDDLVRPWRAVTPGALDLPPHLVAEQYWDLLTGRPSSTLDASRCDCGSGCDGQERPWDCNRPGLTRGACRRVCRDAAHRIRDHVRSRGSIPAGWLRWADEILQPTVDWRRELAAHVRRSAAEAAGRVDFTYRRPSRRQSAVPDVILPSLRQPVPRVAIVIDTSGSISDGMLGQALGRWAVCCEASASRAATCASSAATRRRTRRNPCGSSGASSFRAAAGRTWAAASKRRRRCVRDPT